ncbi:TetR/AcrR family transcriptional regulator [Actinomadura barringtoniae]|uniref:TetR/AcrR family transcriptional regulator n=1 Tax=Actinomadura barringtoniae TaxID=1427535 RepID=A0A939T3E6_9ACTN|nr:TetR/AcrR family transcriptional regulator [Actinomadura barringtoniae]MBO2447998.1 TetR/AcrR family transcriptional regulator [Actinomadura barringtoniae]
MSANTDRVRDPRQRAERATRILDSAAELLAKHGYRRVTIDDVAARAGIGKGTVYLHWKTREQLFGAVFDREVLSAIEELRRALRQDPRVALLHRFARTYFLAIAQRPLLRGFLLGDPDLLGKLAASRDGRDERHGGTSHGYLELLAARGLLRDDMTVGELAYAYQATFEGFLQALQAEPDVSDGVLEERAELLARTVRRAFENEPEPPEEAPADLAAAVIALFTDLIDADRAAAGIPGD